MEVQLTDDVREIVQYALTEQADGLKRALMERPNARVGETPSVMSRYVEVCAKLDAENGDFVKLTQADVNCVRTALQARIRNVKILLAEAPRAMRGHTERVLARYEEALALFPRKETTDVDA